MKIVDHYLCDDDGNRYPFRSTPNMSNRALQPQYLIMHYTVSSAVEPTVKWLSNPRARASAHLVIGRDGSVTQMVPFDKVAWHAGRSGWQGLVGMNNYSIGIELVNLGPVKRAGEEWASAFGQKVPTNEVLEAKHKNETMMTAWQLYTPEQLMTSLEIATTIVQHYEMTDILGHDDIAPGRKRDPGPAFPMEGFRSRIFGREDVTQDDNIYRTTANLNIRSGAGTHFTTITKDALPQGTRLHILESDGVWRHVDVLDVIEGINDLTGWVHGRYIEAV